MTKKPDKELSSDFSQSRLLGRIKDLEILSKRLEQYQDMQSLDWHTRVSELKRGLDQQLYESRLINEQYEELKENFVQLVREFRLKLSLEDYNRFKRRLDNWPIENFVTINEFNNLLKDSL